MKKMSVVWLGLGLALGSSASAQLLGLGVGAGASAEIGVSGIVRGAADGVGQAGAAVDAGVRSSLPAVRMQEEAAIRGRLDATGDAAGARSGSTAPASSGAEVQANTRMQADTGLQATPGLAAGHPFQSKATARANTRVPSTAYERTAAGKGEAQAQTRVHGSSTPASQLAKKATVEGMAAVQAVPRAELGVRSRTQVQGGLTAR